MHSAVKEGVSTVVVVCVFVSFSEVVHLVRHEAKVEK